MKKNGYLRNVALLLAAVFFFALGCVTVVVAEDAREIFNVSTAWKLVGANHKVYVVAFDDPDYPGVTVFLAQAKTGGLFSSFAEDPSRFSMDAVKTAPVYANRKIKDGPAKVFEKRTNPFFKSTRIMRKYDEKTNSLVYLAISSKLVEGSPFNALAVVRLDDETAGRPMSK